MKKPFVLIAAIVAVVGLGAAVAVAKKTTEFKTSVTLEFRYGGSHHPPAFLGSVNAKKGCQTGRRVTLTFGTKKLGSDKSNNRGKYKIFFAIHHRGNYRAVASEKKITKHNGETIVCKPDRSGQFPVTSLPARR